MTRVDAVQELTRVEDQLRQRSLADLSTSQLYAFSLKRRIEREIGPIRLVTPTAAIPNDEYVEEVQEWKP